MDRQVVGKRLGFVRWKRLHLLAYVVPILGVIHFTWRVKKDVREPVTYAVVLALLLLIRAVTFVRAQRAGSPIHRPGDART